VQTGDPPRQFHVTTQVFDGLMLAVAHVAADESELHGA
jgi:hypothetical protein